jgi:hypothetical protein
MQRLRCSRSVRSPTIGACTHSMAGPSRPVHNTAGSRTPDPTSPYPNPTTENYHERLPLQPQPIGSLFPQKQFPQNANPPKLFQELTIRGVTFPNRVWLAPMRMRKSWLAH